MPPPIGWPLTHRHLSLILQAALPPPPGWRRGTSRSNIQQAVAFRPSPPVARAHPIGHLRPAISSTPPGHVANFVLPKYQHGNDTSKCNAAVASSYGYIARVAYWLYLSRCGCFVAR